MNDVYISPVFKLAKDIVESGWLYGNCLNSISKDFEPSERNSIGIYREIKDTIEPWFFGLLKKKVHHQNPKIGMIWINNQSRGAYETTKWVLEIFGNEHIEKLKEFIENTCPVKVEIVLASHNESIYTQTDY